MMIVMAGSVQAALTRKKGRRRYNLTKRMTFLSSESITARQPFTGFILLFSEHIAVRACTQAMQHAPASLISYYKTKIGIYHMKFDKHVH